MNLDALTFRPLRRDELDMVIEWAAAEGWNPGLHDAEVFRQTDTDGFIAAEYEGELVGAGSIVSYGGTYGFMGLFIVRPDLRGEGIGTRLWFYRRDALRERLHDGAAIGMDGVFNMQDWYAEGGFTFSHRNLRMEGIGKACGDMPHGIVSLSDVPFETVETFDTAYFGCPRPTFLSNWIAMPNAIALASWMEGELHGYGVIRQCRAGWKIGPLFADSPEVAESLFVALSGRAAGDVIYLDIPENNPAAAALAARHDMAEVFGCARMYYGEPPMMPWENIYGVTTFELG